MVYITGDIHGEVNIILRQIESRGITKDDVIVILGDAGLNYYNTEGEWINGREMPLQALREYERKAILNNAGIPVLCIHGNHEERPFNIPTYHEKEWHGGVVYVEEQYPNLLFAKDGEIYNFEGKKAVVIGGAYSVDKEYRLRRGMKWFKDEQPSKEIKEYVEQQLEKAGWKIDAVLSHTCPQKYVPVEAFLPSIDQSKVDHSTEEWLDKIENKLKYKEWYCGHWHLNKYMNMYTEEGKKKRFVFLFHDSVQI